MGRDQLPIIHLVDMITCEDEDELGPAPPQQVEVLVDGIRGPSVPMILQPLLRRQHVHELAEPAVEEAPATFQVLNQALRLVLRRDTDSPNTGVDAVRKDEVYDPELAAERHRGLGPVVGKLPQARASPAGEHHRVGRLRGAGRRNESVQHGDRWMVRLFGTRATRRRQICDGR